MRFLELLNSASSTYSKLRQHSGLLLSNQAANPLFHCKSIKLFAWFEMKIWSLASIYGIDDAELNSRSVQLVQMLNLHMPKLAIIFHTPTEQIAGILAPTNY